MIDGCVEVAQDGARLRLDDGALRPIAGEAGHRLGGAPGSEVGDEGVAGEAEFGLHLEEPGVRELVAVVAEGVADEEEQFRLGAAVKSTRAGRAVEDAVEQLVDVAVTLGCPGWQSSLSRRLR